MFLCVKSPCQGWRSADFFTRFFVKNAFWTSANIHTRTSTKISMVSRYLHSYLKTSVEAKVKRMYVSLVKKKNIIYILVKSVPLSIYVVVGVDTVHMFNRIIEI
jgi:hypothetical protein